MRAEKSASRLQTAHGRGTSGKTSAVIEWRAEIDGTLLDLNGSGTKEWMGNLAQRRGTKGECFEILWYVLDEQPCWMLLSHCRQKECGWWMSRFDPTIMWNVDYASPHLICGLG